MLRNMLALALFVPNVIACAALPQTRPSAEQAQVDTVCGRIMGLWTGQPFYPRCAESVTEMLDARAKRVAMMTRAGEAPAPLTIRYPGGPDTEPGRRFDDTSLPVQANRERYACGQLGMMAGTGAFDSCVNDLHEAVMPNRWWRGE